MTRLYLAGPMTGIANLNFPLFHAEAARLRTLGHDVVNPAELNGGADELVACAAMTPEELAVHWLKCMRKDVVALMTCDCIALLPGWERSRGVNVERSLFINLGLPVALAADLVQPVQESHK